MFVIRLPNGNLMVPQTATGNDGRILGDVYVEIGPQDADYARLAEQARDPEEAERRRDRWRQDDEALRQEFEEFGQAERRAHLAGHARRRGVLNSRAAARPGRARSGGQVALGVWFAVAAQQGAYLGLAEPCGAPRESGCW